VNILVDTDGNSATQPDAVTLVFEQVTAQGTISITTKTPGELLDKLTISDQGVSLPSGDGSSYDMAGTILDVGLTAQTQYSGSILVTIPYDEQTATFEEDNVRFLHYNGTGWEDNTVSVDTTANTVTGSVTSLSPVVAGIVQDGTFPAIYFETHPLSKIADTDNGPVTLLLDNQTAAVSVEIGQQITTYNTIMNLQRTSQHFTYVLEVLDDNNVTIDLVFSEGTLDRGGTINLANIWTPNEAGTYTFKVFVIDDIHGTAPELLKQPSTASLEVT
jgi:hypothetical protein